MGGLLSKLLITVCSSSTAGSDYTSRNTILTFGGEAGRKATVNVTILQDTLREPTEAFRASLTLVNANGRTVNIVRPMSTVFISDDDMGKYNIH